MKKCKKDLHSMTKANTYVHPTKGPECRTCKREYMRPFMQRKRQAAKRAAAKAARTKAAKRSTR